MSRPVRPRRLIAGAPWAPAPFAALVIALSFCVPAGAHGPLERKPVTTLPAGVTPPPGVPLDPRALGPAPVPAGAAIPTTGLLPLRQLAAESLAVVEGRTTGSEALDGERLWVYRFRVDRTLQGDVGTPEVTVVEMRGSLQRPPLLPPDGPAILLLRRAPSLSYLAEHLPPGTYFAPTGGRDGVIPIGSDAERTAVETALADGVAIGPHAAGSDALPPVRALAFRELASGSPRLAVDAVIELRRVDPLADLTPAELDALRTTLGNRAVPQPTRIALIRLLGDRDVTAAAPVIAAATVDGPPVLDAVLAARARLGIPPSREELARYLAADDAQIRASAVRALAKLGDASVGEIGRYATADAATDVRVAAIETLGVLQRPSALPVLSQTFADSDRAVRQASARAILAIGGPTATTTLYDLALRGESTETRTYAVLLLLVTNGRDSEPVQRLLAANPSSDVQQLIEHGLRFRHSHQHEE